MKNLYILFALFISLSIFAQTPEGFNYQATVRNSSGTLITNQNVNFKFSLLQNSMTGTAVYVETQTVTTDDLGSVALKVGQGTPTTGTFANINWGSGTYYLAIELNTGSGFTAMGTTQLLSVPYALYAKSSGTAQNLGVSTIFITGNITDAQAAAQIAAEAGPLTQNVIITNTTGLTTVDLSILKNIEGLDIEQNNDLTTVSLNGLTKVFNGVNINNNTALSLLSFPLLTTTPQGLRINQNPALTSVSFPVLSSVGNSSYNSLDLSSNALSSTCVNTILHQLLNIKPSAGKYVNLSSQNPLAAPTGQGITDLATLTNSGNAVTVDGFSTLNFTVTDQNQTNVANVAIALYDSSTATTPIATAVTDANGVVTFKTGLKAQIYYFSASSTGDGNCYNNEFTSNYTTADGSVMTGNTLTAPAAIKAGVNNQKIIVYPVGHVTFTNNTASGCNVYYSVNNGTYYPVTTTPLAAGATTAATDLLAIGYTFNFQFRPVDSITGIESTDSTTFITKTEVIVAPCSTTNTSSSN